MSSPPSKYINRELSWLEFNQRVLDEARDSAVPVLERLRFLSITASNLDEFFMVRVGGLQLLSRQGSLRQDPAGLTADEQLKAISVRTRAMIGEQYQCFLEELEPALREADIRRILPAQLSDRQQRIAAQFLDTEVLPVLTPMAVPSAADFPLLANQMLHLCVRLKAGPEGDGALRFALIPFGRVTSRFINLPAASGYDYILLEDAVAHFADRFFPGEPIEECIAFRITRNADMSVSEDQAADLLQEMEEILDARKQSDCVRLEIAEGASAMTLDFLRQALRVTPENVYAAAGPLDLSAWSRLADLPGFDGLRYEAWPPRPSPVIDPTQSMFEVLTRQDVLLCHPYESYEPVVRLVEEAADDPDVLAIKQTLYRTSRTSPVVAALARAAERGKYVTAIVELKARFDEARNIEWARDLEQSGVQVIYGVKGFKTHAKLCIIVRREPHGIVRYLHFGTGNYNESTARLYSDVSFLTTNEELGADASSFFNAVTGYSQPQPFRKIEAAPLGLRESLLEMIEAETERKKHGQKAHIMAKLNSLSDPQMIDALYAASQAGVKVDLNVRGICCLRPGVEGLSENITVVSIVDRFLEHSRIIYFHHGGDERVFLSSADWMSRNLDRRVELLVPVEDPALRDRLVGILELAFQDTVKGRRLMPNGRYKPHKLGGRRKGVRSQEVLYREAADAIKQAEQSRRTMFEPHRAPGSGF